MHVVRDHRSGWDRSRVNKTIALIDWGIDVNAKDNNGVSALMLAAYKYD